MTVACNMKRDKFIVSGKFWTEEYRGYPNEHLGTSQFFVRLGQSMEQLQVMDLKVRASFEVRPNLVRRIIEKCFRIQSGSLTWTQGDLRPAVARFLPHSPSCSVRRPAGWRGPAQSLCGILHSGYEEGVVGPSTGSVIWNDVPTPCSLSTVMRPPCASTTSFTIFVPSPVPPILWLTA